MGITIAGWQKDLIENLSLRGIAAVPFYSGPCLLLKFEDTDQLVLNLIPVYNTLTVVQLVQLQEDYKTDQKQLVQLWEDVWLTRPAQVISRICSMLGKNRSVHGRKTKIISVTQAEADRFFELYHLQGSAKSRYKYALVLDTEIIAVATFSAKRKMTRKAEGHTSVELIRFATVDGITVQGGLSKLIRHMIKNILPDDVMTYADLDWSQGKGYLKLGFELTEQMPPAELWLDTSNHQRYFPHRLPEEIKTQISTLAPAEVDSYLASLHYNRIFNTGNLKYILNL